MTEAARTYRHYMAAHRKPIPYEKGSDSAKPGSVIMTGSGSQPVIRVPVATVAA